MTDPTDGRAWNVTVEQRLIAAGHAPPIVVALGVSAALFAAYAVLTWIFDLTLRPSHGEHIVPVDDGAWVAIVHSLMVGYALLATHYVVARNGEDFAALDRASRRTKEDLRDRWIGAIRNALPRGRIAFLLGATVGLGVAVYLSWGEAGALKQYLWFYFVSPLMIGLLARSAFFTLEGLRILSHEADDALGIDLLDLSPLAPFARIGLRNAFAWMLGTSVFSLYFVNIPARELVTAYPILAGVFAMSVWALVVPLRRLRRAIRSAKQAELASVRAEVRRRTEKIGERAADTDLTLGLPGVLAYEARIEAVREWPLDVSTLARFLLYLAIPLGSWVGGAFVERLLAAIID